MGNVKEPNKENTKICFHKQRYQTFRTDYYQSKGDASIVCLALDIVSESRERGTHASWKETWLWILKVFLDQNCNQNFEWKNVLCEPWEVAQSRRIMILMIWRLYFLFVSFMVSFLTFKGCIRLPFSFILIYISSRKGVWLRSACLKNFVFASKLSLYIFLLHFYSTYHFHLM